MMEEDTFKKENAIMIADEIDSQLVENLIDMKPIDNQLYKSTT